MNKKTVLLIEDNPDDIELTTMAFRKHKLLGQLVVLTNGMEALDYLFGQNDYAPPNQPPLPQLILLDINLPKLNGIEVLRRIRSEERTKLIPIVMLTSSEEASDRYQSYALHANSYIRKPVNFERFTEAVDQLGLYWLTLNHPPPQADIGE